MTPAADRHFIAARKALERNQAEICLGHIVGLLKEIISPSQQDAGVDSDDVIDGERQ